MTFIENEQAKDNHHAMSLPIFRHEMSISSTCTREGSWPLVTLSSTPTQLGPSNGFWKNSPQEPTVCAIAHSLHLFARRIRMETQVPRGPRQLRSPRSVKSEWSNNTTSQYVGRSNRTHPQIPQIMLGPGQAPCARGRMNRGSSERCGREQTTRLRSGKEWKDACRFHAPQIAILLKIENHLRAFRGTHDPGLGPALFYQFRTPSSL